MRNGLFEVGDVVRYRRIVFPPRSDGTTATERAGVETQFVAPVIDAHYGKAGGSLIVNEGTVERPDPHFVSASVAELVEGRR